MKNQLNNLISDRKHSPLTIVHGFAIPKSKSFGYTLKRELRYLKPRQKLRYILLITFQELWNELAAKHPTEEAKLRENKLPLFQAKKLYVLSSEKFQQFYESANKAITSVCTSQQSLLYGFDLLDKFISFQNQNIVLPEFAYHKPFIVSVNKNNPLSIAENYVSQGKSINKIVQAVLELWEYKNDFSVEENIAWLIFSGIFFGGINEPNDLLSWLKTLLSETSTFIAFDDRFIMTIEYETHQYGLSSAGNLKHTSTKDQVTAVNSTILQEDSYSHKATIISQQICVDTVSLLWRHRLMKLIKNDAFEKVNLQNILSNLKTPIDLEKMLNAYLIPLCNEAGIPIETFRWLLRNASYFWEMMPHVYIDQTSVGVMQGKFKTMGLHQENFKNLLSHTYGAKPEAKIDLIKLLKQTIVSTSNRSLTQRELVKQVRYSAVDLIDNLKINVFQFNQRDHAIKAINTIIINSKFSLPEKILVKWILHLLENNNKRKRASLDSIFKYVSTIGYEWLHFTKGESIENWDTTDFEDLYDDILSFKQEIKNNQDYRFSGRLMQRMHNFAVSTFKVAPCKISDISNHKRIRVEWIPPMAYQQLLNQLSQSLDPLYVDIFQLFFILLYRCGLRKKELLGLRYDDIEGMQLNEPSIVIRPNVYRQLKTAGSHRRIPLHGLLTHQELALFMDYVRTHQPLHRQANRFIFSLTFDSQPIPEHVPLQLLKECMQLIGYQQHVTLHGFRHTAVTNLALCLTAPPYFTELLTGYSADFINQINQQVLGVHHNMQDRWFALAALVGHITPRRTVEVYHHAIMLNATYQITASTQKLPFQTISNISGLTVNQLNKKHIKKEDGDISLQQLKQIIRAAIFNVQSIKSSKRLKISNTETHGMNAKQSDKLALLEKYHFRQIENFLILIESSKLSNQEASIRSGLDIVDSNYILNRAYALAQRKTKKNVARFIKTGTQFELPAIRLNHERTSLPLLRKNALELKKHQLDNYLWWFSCLLNKITTSHCFVTFPMRRLDDLKRFIDLSVRLLPSQNWTIQSNPDSFKQLTSNINDKNIRFEINESINDLHVGIAISRHGKKNISDYQFSPVLRYFVYYMTVLDQDIPLNS